MRFGFLNRWIRYTLFTFDLRKTIVHLVLTEGLMLRIGQITVNMRRTQALKGMGFVHWSLHKLLFSGIAGSSIT